MMRAIPAAAGLTAALALAACGSGTNATTTGAKSTPTAQPSGGPNGFRRNAAAGELVQITGTSLVLNTTTGDVTVDFTGSTPVTRTHTGTVADITTGSCILASGQKDATGTVTASTVVVNATVSGSCQGPGLFGNGGQRSPGASPRPSFSPRPGTPPIAVARGQVTTVAGTAVTVKQPDGTSTTITVPTTVHVSVVQLAATSDLSVGDCVLATGPRNSAGVVTARSLNIQPAGPSGCFTGGGFGFGFGGRGFGGGGGGGFGGGAPGGGGFGGGGEGGGGAGA